MADPDHKDSTEPHPDHDIIDVEAHDAHDAHDADESTSPETTSSNPSSGGGFVWVLAVIIVIAGGLYAGWPYIGPYAEPYVKEIRAALGLQARPTQPSLPGSVVADRTIYMAQQPF